MLKVMNILSLGDKLALTLDGDNDKLKNGSILIDSSGNIIEVLSVGMVRRENADYFNNSTTVLIGKCDIAIGSELNIA